MKKIRHFKIFLGSVLIGLFVGGCGSSEEKRPDRKCYKPPHETDSAMVAREDSIQKADSLKKADSLRIADSLAKAKKMKKGTKPNPKPVHEKTCYMPARTND